MLKIPVPEEKKSIKFNVSESAKKELDTYVAFVQSKQPHATADAVVEAMIAKIVPRAGAEAKEYREFKRKI